MEVVPRTLWHYISYATNYVEEFSISSFIYIVKYRRLLYSTTFCFFCLFIICLHQRTPKDVANERDHENIVNFLAEERSPVNIAEFPRGAGMSDVSILLVVMIWVFDKPHSHTSKTTFEISIRIQLSPWSQAIVSSHCPLHGNHIKWSRMVQNVSVVSQ